MFRRVLLLVASLFVIGAMVLPQASSAGPKAIKKWSQDWLALNHTRYDNSLTAAYERQIGYGKGSLSAPDVLHGRAGADVRMSNASFSQEQNEFQIDINPTDSHFAIGASNDSLQSGTGVYATRDGGKTWIARDLPLGLSSCCDPGVAYGADGTAYFINLGFDAFHIMKSTNNGQTWQRMTDIVPPDDRTNIVVDNGSTSPFKGRVYVTYTDFGTTGATNEIKLYYSDDGAVTWTGPVNVSHTGQAGLPYPQSSQPRVADDGTVYVGYQYYPDGTYSSAQDRIAKSTNGGVSFAASTLISAGPHLQGGLDLGDQRGYFAVNAGCTTFRHRSFPIIGVDPTNSQNVYAEWAGGNLEQTYACGSFHGYHSDILFSRSTNGGTTWSAPVKVNDDPPGHDQYYGWMDVSPNGTIWIGWHDRRDDPSNFKHVWYMDRSKDGGLTFGTDKKIGDVASLPSDFIGDYAGLAADRGLVLPMWWDSRTSASGEPYTQQIRLS